MKPISRTSALSAALMLSLVVAAHAAEQTRAFRQPFPAKGEVRLANLAGRIELVPGQGSDLVLDATVHADAGSAAENQQLLAGMKWVRSHDKKGREEWALSYPVEKYRSYAYPSSRDRDKDKEDSELPAFLSFLNL